MTSLLLRSGGIERLLLNNPKAPMGQIYFGFATIFVDESDDAWTPMVSAYVLNSQRDDGKQPAQLSLHYFPPIGDIDYRIAQALYFVTTNSWVTYQNVPAKREEVMLFIEHYALASRVDEVAAMARMIKTFIINDRAGRWLDETGSKAA